MPVNNYNDIVWTWLFKPFCHFLNQILFKQLVPFCNRANYGTLFCHLDRRFNSYNYRLSTLLLNKVRNILPHFCTIMIGIVNNISLTALYYLHHCVTTRAVNKGLIFWSIKLRPIGAKHSQSQFINTQVYRINMRYKPT